ncbi:hypothetical protein SAMN04489835_4838 [Mycolicibacterium rutilum]|uniref:Lipoprotein LpqN n=1 Tax=Mycolicibacterium rutilum TaxID=370526 RepID=A0A1H6LJE4_MYCRU|nr:LpqN/LpqT family lipoprotein [Mycolicibacterium rutilum]SEH84720.1 hypothetical protein SAMN04489835_4838 [Mycolicibacterium rutilum]
MNTAPTVKKLITVTAVAATVALAGVGCTAVTAGTAMPDRDVAAVSDTACRDVDAPKVEIAAANTAEPQLRIPQPEGWTTTTDPEAAPDIRFTQTFELSEDESPHVVVVAVSEVANISAEALLDKGSADIVALLEEDGLSLDGAVEDHTVCGLPARTLSWEDTRISEDAPAGDEPAPAAALQVVAKGGGRTYHVLLMIGGEYDNPTYQRDAEAILAGFEVLPANSRI